MSICDVPVISAVCDTAGEAAASLVAAPFDWLAQSMGGAAAWMIEAMWAVFDSTTFVDVTNPRFAAVYNLLFGIAVFVVLLFFCLQLMTGMIKRDPTALSRAALGVAKAVLSTFIVLTLTGLALEIVDQLCIGIVQAAGESTESMGDKFVLLAASLSTLNVAAPGVGAIVTIFLAGLMITAVAIVWFSLLIRKVLLLVAIVLGPIAFSGASWDATRGWISKWVAFVVALIVSKLVLVVVFLVAITQIASPIELDLAAVADPIAGIVLLFVAAFAPYMVYRFISFLGFDVYNQMGTEQEAKDSLNRPVPVPGKPHVPEPKKVLDGDSGSGSSAPADADTPTPTPTSTSTSTSTTGIAPQDAGKVAPGGGGAGATGGGAAGSGGGAGAGAAAAGPAAVAVVGAQFVRAAATAGPALGQSIGGQAEAVSAAADQPGSTPAAATASTPPPANSPLDARPSVPPKPAGPHPHPQPAPGDE